MVVSLCLLLLCQLFGEVLARATNLPVPGPVIGMVLLFLLLLLRNHIPFVPRETRDGSLAGVCRGLLQNLSLLFVPAGVGVVQRLDLLARYGVGLGIAIVASTVITLLVSVAAFRVASKFFTTDDIGGEA
jgi:holin-like protein